MPRECDNAIARYSALIVLILFVLSSRALAANPLDACPMATTLATTYNDLRLDPDPRPAGYAIDLPPAVRKTLLGARADVLKNVDPSEYKDLTCGEANKPIYRITLKNTYQIYVADFELVFGGFFAVAAFDPKSSEATSKPWLLYNHFYGNLEDRDGYLRPPLISGSDIHRTGHLDLVFEERVHNGTTYNGLVYHYFSFGPHMELRPILALEPQVDCWDFQLKRQLTIFGTDHLELKTFENSDPDHHHWQYAGKLVLRANGNDGVFHISGRYPNSLKFPSRYVMTKAQMQILLTTCDPNITTDDRWISKGMEFYY